MAISFVNKGSFASGTTSAAPGIPASMQAGDFMVLVVETEGASVSVSAGWTQVTGSPLNRGTANSAGGVRLAVYTRAWVSGDAAPTVTTTGAGHAVSMIFGFRGVDTTTPLDGVTPTTTSAAANATLTMPGITTATDDAVVVHCMALDSDNISSNSVTGNPLSARSQTCNGAVASGATTILLNAIANVAVGMTITGSASIPANTRVTAIATNTITLSAATTGTITSGTSLTFTGVNFTGFGTSGELHDQTVATARGGGIFVAAGLKLFAGATGTSTAAQTSSAYLGITLSLRAAAIASASTGTASVTLGAFALGGVGAQSFAGVGAVTLNAFSVSGTGASGGTGTASVTLDAFTLSGAGAQSFTGVGAASLGAFAVGGVGAQSFAGTAGVTLSNFTLTGAGAQSFAGVGAVTLDAFTLGATGAQSGVNATVGTLGATLGAFALGATGVNSFTGAGAVTLGAFALGGVGAQSFAGVGSPTLGAFTLAGTGAQTVASATSGTASVTLSAFTLGGAGSGRTLGGRLIRRFGKSRRRPEFTEFGPEPAPVEGPPVQISAPRASGKTRILEALDERVERIAFARENAERAVTQIKAYSDKRRVELHRLEARLAAMQAQAEEARRLKEREEQEELDADAEELLLLSEASARDRVREMVAHILEADNHDLVEEYRAEQAKQLKRQLKSMLKILETM